MPALAGQCRFRDCRHEAEPGCAIQAAPADGRLERQRYQSYPKLQAELGRTAAERAGREREEDFRRGREFARYHRDRQRRLQFERGEE